jgi:hypothetical protein
MYRFFANARVPRLLAIREASVIEACKKSPLSVASGPNGMALVLTMPRKGAKEPRKLL